MRENRPYGSEGGVGESRSLPLLTENRAGSNLKARQTLNARQILNARQTLSVRRTLNAQQILSVRRADNLVSVSVGPMFL